MTRVIDATLREGMQTVAGTFSIAQSVETARLLAAAGVDTIECGHPSVGERERDRVAAVVKAVPDVPVLTHARACRGDIEAAADTGARWVGVFLGVNQASRDHRIPGATQEQLHQLIAESIKYAHDLGLAVRMTIEDSGRTPPEELLDALDVAVAAGAERLCFSDTVGILEPVEVAHRVRAVRERHPDTDLELHMHDDRGLALANALAGIDAGATWVSTAVNSLGERAGITDLAVLLVNLHLRGTRALPGPGVLQALSRRVGAYSRSHPDERRPVVGRNVFHHQARLHVKATEQDPSTYEVLSPDLLGRSRSLALDSETSTEWSAERLIITPPVISAEELRHHRKGPGERYVLVDDRLVPRAGQYCIARRIPPAEHHGRGHIDPHVHAFDSLFGFLGDREDYRGLTVEVRLGDSLHTLTSPASVFIPAGTLHSYRAVTGSGTYLNHVLSGSYEGSLLDPLPEDPETGALVPGRVMTNPVNNAKSTAWDHVGGLFWNHGRTSARPSGRELAMYLDGVLPGQRCAVVGASTKELVEAARDLGAHVTVLDFSVRMCRDLADAVPGIEVHQMDITRPVLEDLRASQDWVFSDRLLNRFAGDEAAAGARGLLSLVRPGGVLRTSVKLGRYPMDDRMIDVGRQRGTVDDFWDAATSTMDFAAAGDVLEEALLPHGDIDRGILLQWYRGRGREKRFTDAEVRALLTETAARPPDDLTTAPLQDAPGSSMYTVLTSTSGG